MKKLSQYLKKFQNLTPPDIFLKKSFRKLIQKEINIKIDIKNIEYKNSTIFIRVNPLIKNEIFLKKDLLLKKLNTKPGEVYIKDIR